jgi:hypothetical protein
MLSLAGPIVGEADPHSDILFRWNACDALFPFVTDRLFAHFPSEPILKTLREEKQKPKDPFYLVNALIKKPTKKRKRGRIDMEDYEAEEKAAKAAAKKAGDMPCPIQDIVDAIAILVVGASLPISQTFRNTVDADPDAPENASEPAVKAETKAGEVVTSEVKSEVMPPTPAAPERRRPVIIRRR